MKKKDRSMPGIVFIGPPQKRHKFKQVLFVVLECDKDGIPTKLEMVKDDAVFDIEGGEAFMTGYVLSAMTEPSPEQANYKRKEE